MEWNWQQWYMIAVIAANFIVSACRENALGRLMGLGWTLLFIYVLISAGFFPWT